MGYKLNNKKRSTKDTVIFLVIMFGVLIAGQAIGRAMFAKDSTTTTNSQISTSSAEQIMEEECVKGIPDISAQMKSYCKCMGKKVISTYGVKKASDMGLSMNQDQLIQEFTPLANQCISELGIQL